MTIPLSPAGFLRDLSAVEILLYFFLVTVSDRNGSSFYHDDKICSLLKIGLVSLGEARDVLVSKSLLAYEYPIYHVLSLPPQPVTSTTSEEITFGQMKKDSGGAQMNEGLPDIYEQCLRYLEHTREISRRQISSVKKDAGFS